jgi:hypothetical protein
MEDPEVYFQSGQETVLSNQDGGSGGGWSKNQHLCRASVIEHLGKAELLLNIDAQELLQVWLLRSVAVSVISSLQAKGCALALSASCVGAAARRGWVPWPYCRTQFE